MADSRATATLTVDIVASCVTEDERTNALQLQLDSDLNGGNTCFTPNTDVYIMLFATPWNLDYSIEISDGTIQRYPAGDGEVRYTEYVQIVNGEGSTSKPITALESMEWQGKAPCAISEVQYDESGYKYLKCPSCSGSPECGDSCEVVNGILKVTYRAAFRSYVINVPSVEEVLITAYENLTGDCTT